MDIVERLRMHIIGGGVVIDHTKRTKRHKNVLSEAADEIEKLRAENKESTTLVFDMSAERDELIAENKELRATMKQSKMEACIIIAKRRALEGKEG